VLATAYSSASITVAKEPEDLFCTARKDPDVMSPISAGRLGYAHALTHMQQNWQLSAKQSSTQT